MYWLEKNLFEGEILLKVKYSEEVNIRNGENLIQGKILKILYRKNIDTIKSGLARVLVSRLDTMIKSKVEGASLSRLNTILDEGDIDMIRSGLVNVSSIKTGYYDQFEISRCISFKTRHHDQLRVSRCISLKTECHDQLNDKVNTFQGKYSQEGRGINTLVKKCTGRDNNLQRKYLERIILFTRKEIIRKEENYLTEREDTRSWKFFCKRNNLLFTKKTLLGEKYSKRKYRINILEMKYILMEKYLEREIFVTREISGR